MIDLSDYLQARPPSLREKRGDRELLIWGELGQWLVVDADVTLLLDRFAGKRLVGDILGECARAGGLDFQTVVDETLPVIEALAGRGILGLPPRAPAPPVEPLRIANLTFNITNRCNLRCPWCYNGLGQENEIPVADLLAWIGQSRASLDDDATFIILGGEPFLDEARLLACVRGARRQFSAEVLVSTNGTILSRGTARDLAKAAVTVQISVDSAESARHDSIRGTGVFQRAITTAKELISAQVRTILSMVMTRRSEEEFEAYLELAAAIGADEVRFIPLRRIGRGVAHSVDAPELYHCFQKLVEVLRRKPEFSRLLHRDFFSILMTACRYSRLRDNCGIGRRCLFVDADGALYPCPNHRAPQYRCGHIQMAQLPLLDSSPVLRSCREQYRLAEMPVCRECQYRFWCAGDCRAEALTVRGEPTAPSPYCDDLKRIMREMFWLIADDWQGLASREQTIRPWS